MPPLSDDSHLYSDSVGRSGMFCAIATAIDRCKTEGMVDVFQVVKVQRTQKPGLIRDVVSTELFVCFFLVLTQERMIMIVEGELQPAMSIVYCVNFTEFTDSSFSASYLWKWLWHWKIY